MLTLAEAKQHLVIEDSDDDDLIEALIRAATEFVEGHTRRAVEERTEVLVLDGFSNPIELPLVPVRSITSVKYIDPDGVEQTLLVSDYRLDGRGLRAELHCAYGKQWPNVHPAPATVTVEYLAGYEAGKVPEQLKQAAKLIVGSLYDQREDHVIGTIVNKAPISAQYLMQRFEIPVVG